MYVGGLISRPGSTSVCDGKEKVLPETLESGCQPASVASPEAGGPRDCLGVAASYDHQRADGWEEAGPGGGKILTPASEGVISR